MLGAAGNDSLQVTGIDACAGPSQSGTQRGGRIRARRSPTVAHCRIDLIFGHDSGDSGIQQPGRHGSADQSLRGGLRTVVPAVKSDVFGEHIEQYQRLPYLGGFIGREVTAADERIRHVVGSISLARAATNGVGQ